MEKATVVKVPRVRAPKAKVEKASIISSGISFDRDGVTFQRVETLEGHKVQFTIHSDAIKVQSYARVKVWKDLQWSLVHSIPVSSMKTREGLCYLPINQTGWYELQHFYFFEVDYLELKRIAKGILA